MAEARLVRSENDWPTEVCCEAAAGRARPSSLKRGTWLFTQALFARDMLNVFFNISATKVH